MGQSCDVLSVIFHDITLSSFPIQTQKSHFSCFSKVKICQEFQKKHTQQQQLKSPLMFVDEDEKSDRKGYTSQKDGQTSSTATAQHHHIDSLSELGKGLFLFSEMECKVLKLFFCCF
jgi:hypothetical protein